MYRVTRTRTTTKILLIESNNVQCDRVVDKGFFGLVLSVGFNVQHYFQIPSFCLCCNMSLALLLVLFWYVFQCFLQVCALSIFVTSRNVDISNSLHCCVCVIWWFQLILPKNLVCCSGLPSTSNKIHVYLWSWFLTPNIKLKVHLNEFNSLFYLFYSLSDCKLNYNIKPRCLNPNFDEITDQHSQQKQ